MAYQRRILAAATVFDAEENGVWTFADFNGDGSQDLVYIKTRNTGTGKVEVHAAINEARFQQHNLATGTVFDLEDNGTWLMHDYTGDGKADLVYIKTRNTGTNTVEVHIADAASGYQNYVLQTGTCFGCEDNGIWTMSPKGDLVFIRTRNVGSNMVEYHVASKSSNYQQFTQQITTGFNIEDNGTWCIAPKCDGDFADLYYIKTRNTGTNMVEVHAVSASSGWKSRLIDVSSSFDLEENGQWLMIDFTHQKEPDLAYVKTRSTGSGQTEVHIVASNQVVPSSYTQSSQNVRIESNTVMRADLARNNGSWRDATIDLNMFLGNMEGKFTWGKKGFQESARNIQLQGSVLSAELSIWDGPWVSSSFDLRDYIMNNDGVFQAIDVPVLLAIPDNQKQDFLDQLDEIAQGPDFKIRAVEEKDGVTIFYANAGAQSEGVIFKTCTAEARASILHLVQSHGKPLEQVNVDVFTTGVSATAGTYLGVEAGVSLIKAEASIFDLNLGVGVDTGAGIKDDSLSVEALGCGFQLGRKVSISVFGAGFGVDFGRLFS